MEEKILLKQVFFIALPSLQEIDHGELNIAICCPSLLIFVSRAQESSLNMTGSKAGVLFSSQSVYPRETKVELCPIFAT